MYVNNLTTQMKVNSLEQEHKDCFVDFKWPLTFSFLLKSKSGQTSFYNMISVNTR